MNYIHYATIHSATAIMSHVGKKKIDLPILKAAVFMEIGHFCKNFVGTIIFKDFVVIKVFDIVAHLMVE